MTAAWEEDMNVAKEGIRLMFCNEFNKARTCFVKRVKAGFLSDAHDNGGLFKSLVACVDLFECLSSGAIDRLGSTLDTLWEAESLCSDSKDQWVGQPLIRGICLLCGGCIQVAQQTFIRAGVNLVKSWSVVGSNISKLLVYEGIEAELVRSLSLFVLGGLNLVVSHLPPSIVSLAELAGFDGSVKHVFFHLRVCYEQQGIFSGFASFLLGNYLVYVQSFFYSFPSNKEIREVEHMLKWADKKFPGSWIFATLDISLAMCQKDPNRGRMILLPEAVSLFASTTSPALLFLLYYRKGLCCLCTIDFLAAAENFQIAGQIQENSGKKSYVVYLGVMEALSLESMEGERNEHKKRIKGILSKVKSYRKFIDLPNVWLPSDLWAFRIALDKIDQIFPETSSSVVSLIFSCMLFASCIDKFPAPFLSVLEKLIYPISEDENMTLLIKCKSKLIISEVNRLRRKYPEALDCLDMILDSDDRDMKEEGCDKDALVPLALCNQAIIFVECGEFQAAEEALKDFDCCVSQNAGFLGALGGGTFLSSPSSEYEMLLSFKRVAILRKINSIKIDAFESVSNSSEDS